MKIELLVTINIDQNSLDKRNAQRIALGGQPVKALDAAKYILTNALKRVPLTADHTIITTDTPLEPEFTMRRVFQLLLQVSSEKEKAPGGA
jgi:hypothetical protein